MKQIHFPLLDKRQPPEVYRFAIIMAVLWLIVVVLALRIGYGSFLLTILASALTLLFTAAEKKPLR
jgi:hypothetical protein